MSLNLFVSTIFVLMPALIFVPSPCPRIICILIKDAYPCSELSWSPSHSVLSVPKAPIPSHPSPRCSPTSSSHGSFGVWDQGPNPTLIPPCSCSRVQILWDLGPGTKSHPHPPYSCSRVQILWDLGPGTKSHPHPTPLQLQGQEKGANPLGFGTRDQIPASSPLQLQKGANPLGFGTRDQIPPSSSLQLQRGANPLGFGTRDQIPASSSLQLQRGANPLGFGTRDQIPASSPLQPQQQEEGAGGWQLPRGVRPSQEILGVGKEGKALPDIHVQSCWIQPGLVDSALLCFCFSCFSATFSADFLLHCTGLLYF
nr:uncharacterized protein LOC115496891 isoform X2 [Taeniopygia guttata]